MSLVLSSLDGRVLLKGFLGEGGMGQVHRAWDTALERPVAVKFFRCADPQEAERLLLEARLQARVDHPHVVKVHEVGTLEGRPCIVLQLVEGRSLAELALDLPLGVKVELLRQVAEGLHAAHRQGLLHRDIKPANVLVEEAPQGMRALVSDFGLARDQDGGLTRSGFPAGTLDFMSPEQLLGRGPLDFRSDVYALGATLYSVLAGRHPYRESLHSTSGGLATPGSNTGSEVPSDLLRRILEDAPPPLKGMVPGLPPELAVIVAKAMEKDPAQRYASAEAFAEDLGRFQGGEPIHARAPWLLERALKWGRRNRMAAQALGVAGLAVTLGIGFGLWTSHRAGTEALETARLGAEAAAIEEIIRTECLLPAHDLRPGMARVRAILADLPRHRPMAPGPAAFVLGRGLQLLGETEPARVALARAWALGFQNPAVARALGEVEGQRYAEELALLPRIDDLARRQARVAALQARFRDPALARLRAAAPTDASDQPLLAARMAQVEGRFEEAARLAAEAGRAPARAAEAAELEGRSLLAAGQAKDDQRTDQEGAIRQLSAAAGALRRAGQIARSAQAPRILLAQAELRLTKIAAHQRGPKPEQLLLVDAALDEAAALDPDNPNFLAIASEVASERGRFQRSLGKDSSEANSAALAFARRAVTASSDPRRPLERLAWACVNIGREILDGGTRDPGPVWAEGLQAAARARALSPDSSTPIALETHLLFDRSTRESTRGGDGLADAQAAAVNARRLIEIGDRPILARSLASQALRALGMAQLQQGADPSADFTEAVRMAGEVIALSGEEVSSLAYGIYTAAAQVEAELAEGRAPGQALTLGTVWAEKLLARQKTDMISAAQVGEWTLLRARAEALAGRDPRPFLDQAERLLLPVAQAGTVGPLLWQRLAEAALERAAWARTHSGNPAPMLREASERARRLQKGDPTSSDGPLLEARVLLAQARPDPPGAVLLGEASVKLNPRDPSNWLVLAQAREAAGRHDAAREAFAKAKAIRPRLAGLAELEVRLGR